MCTEKLDVVSVRPSAAAKVNARVNETVRCYDHKIIAKGRNWQSATVALRMSELHAETERLKRAAVEETSIPLLH